MMRDPHMVAFDHYSLFHISRMCHCVTPLIMWRFITAMLLSNKPLKLPKFACIACAR